MELLQSSTSSVPNLCVIKLGWWVTGGFHQSFRDCQDQTAGGWRDRRQNSSQRNLRHQGPWLFRALQGESQYKH